QRIKKISIANAQGKAKELLEGTKKAMGTELNLFSTFANSPAALEAYLHCCAANVSAAHIRKHTR
ncbi:TPA: hypothetical protein ACJIJ1_002831, partial [Legionella pneumophila]